MLFRFLLLLLFPGVGLRVISQNVSAVTFGCTFSDEWSGVMGVSKRTLGVLFPPSRKVATPKVTRMTGNETC